MGLPGVVGQEVLDVAGREVFEADDGDRGHAGEPEDGVELSGEVRVAHHVRVWSGAPTEVHVQRALDSPLLFAGVVQHDQVVRLRFLHEDVAAAGGFEREEALLLVAFVVEHFVLGLVHWVFLEDVQSVAACVHSGSFGSNCDLLEGFCSPRSTGDEAAVYLEALEGVILGLLEDDRLGVHGGDWWRGWQRSDGFRRLCASRIL